MKRREIEREKLRYAKMTDGFSHGVSFSQGIVIGGEGLSGLLDSGSHGLVIPWMGDKNISIVVSYD